jgi:hypothetical protein
MIRGIHHQIRGDQRCLHFAPTGVASQQRNLCSCSGTAHFGLRQSRHVLHFVYRGWKVLMIYQFSNPASRSARMPAAFSIKFVLMTLLLAGPALAGTPYDGVWDVTVETRAGSCDPSAQFRLTVQDGKISGGATGTVAHEGMVKVTLNGAYAFGQLGGHAGSGRWNAASAGRPCSGRWQATKE